MREYLRLRFGEHMIWPPLKLAQQIKPRSFYEDDLAIAAFYAINQGVVVCCAAGNDGPKPKTTHNGAPWILTVGASTTDRRFASTVQLGNGVELQSETLYQPKDFVPEIMPLVRFENDIDKTGKMVVCNFTESNAELVVSEGAAAAIFVHGKDAGYNLQHRGDDGVKILAFVSSITNPTAKLVYRGLTLDAPWSPRSGNHGRVEYHAARVMITYRLKLGHVNPKKALDPGLVYDYNPYLCGLGYNDDQVSAIVHPRPCVKCSKVKKITASKIKYPSISVFVSANNYVAITRTNVGEPKDGYSIEIGLPERVAVKIMPTKLVFDELKQKKTFTVSFKRTTGGGGGGGGGVSRGKTVEGYMKWVSKKRFVQSPISITFN